jgi:hypothetical protein
MGPLPERPSHSQGSEERLAAGSTCLALQRKKAAHALDVGVDTFDRHIRPIIRCVYIGSVRLYPVSELERVLRENMQ